MSKAKPIMKALVMGFALLYPSTLNKVSYKIMQIKISRYITRQNWLNIHLYLALVFGLGFVLIGLTGSLNVYRAEIDALFNPELVITPPVDAQILSLDKVFAAVRRAEPNRYGVWTLELPAQPNQPITAWFEKPHETFDQYYAPLMLTINPYTGEIVAKRFWGQTLTTWVLDLHSHLQLGADGKKMLAILALCLMLSIASGLYLWWPGWQRLRFAFLVRHDLGMISLGFDLHKLLGLGSAGFLFLLAFTGFHLAYPPLLEAITSTQGMGHGDEGPNVHSSGVPNDRPVSISEAVLVARGLFPSSDLRRVTTPLGDTGTYRINLRQHHEINQRHPVTMLWVDRWSGQIREVRNPVKFSPAQSFTLWLWPLHTGEALGLDKFCWFLIGLTPLFLYISGLCHFLHRRGLIKDRPLDIKAGSKKIAAWLRFSQQTAIKTALFLKPKLLLLLVYLKKITLELKAYIRQNHIK